MRRPNPSEDLPGATARPAPSQPGNDRLADVEGKRQAFVLGALAPDEELAFSPVDVVETQPRHLASA